MENEINPAFRQFIEKRNHEPQPKKANPEPAKEGINPAFAQYIEERNQQFINTKKANDGKNNHQ